MTEPTELLPTPGSRWTHRNGAPYTVLMIANVDTQDEARYPVTVVYQGDNGKVWSRPASDWHRSMTAAPQPTQAQAGAVPLTTETDCGGESCDCRSYCKKKGGQHGAE